MNESRLLDYLVEEFDRDDEIGTFYQDIYRMPAGHAMRVTEQGVKTWRYWNPGNLPALEFASLEECTEAFLAQLRVAVKCRLRSIGPVGAMLSGGMDSSSIVGLISKEFRSELKQPLKTFSLIREDRENCPDWRAIREMLKDDWLDPVIITSALSSDVCRSYFDNIKNLNEPFALSQGFTDSLVFNAARENGCRVVLDGMAGDLLFYSFDRSMDCILREKMFAQIPACSRCLSPSRLRQRFFAGVGLEGFAPGDARKSYVSFIENYVTGKDYREASQVGRREIS